MDTPLELTFKDMEPSAEIEALVHQRVARLEAIHDRIHSCHVYVMAPADRHQQGSLFKVTVEVRIGGDELAVRHNQGDKPVHQHLKVAVRDAFKKMERRLLRWKQTRGGDVKAHEGQLQGKVAEINYAEGFGQIAAGDGRLVYFHRNSVVTGKFDDLRQGDAVELVVQSEESDVGPQASTVRPIGALRYTAG